MRQPTALLYPFFAIVLWAGNVIVSKLAATTIHPSAITFYRLALAVGMMSIFLLRTAYRNRALIRRHLAQLALLGFLAMALFQSLSYAAADTTTATNMAIVTALIPLLTMLLSLVLLRETPTMGMLAGGLLALGGLVYLISEGSPGNIILQGVHRGDAYMLLASTSYALYGVLLRRWNIPVKGWLSTYIQALSALLFMAPVMLMAPAGEAALNRTTIPLILYAGCLASIVLPFLWIQGIKALGPNRCSMFMNLLPVLTAVIAIILLGERLQSYHVMGGIASLAGILLAQTWHTRIARVTSTTGPERLDNHGKQKQGPEDLVSTGSVPPGK